MSGIPDATETADRTLKIFRDFDAPRADVYRAFAEMDRYAQWMGPEGVRVIECNSDLRVGGAYRTVFRSAEGKTHIVAGRFREVVPDERLVFTWAWEQGGDSGPETIVTIEFIDRAGGTRVRLTQAVFDTLETRDHHAAGWEGSLDRLEAYLA